MRAIEQGLPLARAANTGISAMIDPYGRVTASLGLGQEGALDAIIPGPLPATFYARHGDFWGLTATLALLGLTVCALNRGIFLKLRR
jgi:apolipoprotein N-acyltransferase